MFLSRISLQPAIAKESQLGLLLKDRSYGMHRLLWDLFDQGERFLFREESQKEQLGRSCNMPMYYVVSKTIPIQESSIFSIETKPFNPKLRAGDQLAFRLRANPIVAKAVEGRKNSVKHDVVMDAQSTWLQDACKCRGLPETGKKSELKSRLRAHDDFSCKDGQAKLQELLETQASHAAKNWLCCRGELLGVQFKPDQLQTTAYRWNALPEKGRHAGFSSIDYEGILTVIDPVAFVDRVGQGVGPSKAFGCGLMLIRHL